MWWWTSAGNGRLDAMQYGDDETLQVMEERTAQASCRDYGTGRGGCMYGNRKVQRRG